MDIQIKRKIADIDQVEWDYLSDGQPFQSYQWYAFGERVMSDCAPIYMILRQNNQPVARATFYLIKNEPLPIPPFLRRLIAPIFRRLPLLICRSPLANASGLILPDTSPLREEALEKIAQTGQAILKEYRGSFLIFDYLEEKEANIWKKPFAKITGGDPDTAMYARWSSFDEYLEKNTRKFRKNYKRNLREIAKQGILIERKQSVDKLEEAEVLIRKVSRRHRSAPNPWTRGMMQHLSMVDGHWLTASVSESDQLVGCVLTLRDGDAEILTAPGLEDNIPFIYFGLLYEGIKLAIERKIRLLRWGSGAYDVKRRLGFELEHNNQLVFISRSSLVQRIIHYFI